MFLLVAQDFDECQGHPIATFPNKPSQSEVNEMLLGVDGVHYNPDHYTVYKIEEVAVYEIQDKFVDVKGVR